MATQTISTSHASEPGGTGTPEFRKPKSSVGDKVVGSISHGVLVIWSIIVVVPLLWTVLSSFKTSSEIFDAPFALPSVWRFENYLHAWTDSKIGGAFLNTVIVVGCALVLVMLLGSMCAYVLARFKFPGSRAIYIAMLAGLTFPVFLAIVPLFGILQSLGLLGTHVGLILVFTAFALPFTVFFLFSFFKSLPFEIAEAAAIDGAGEWRTFFQVMLPMARPGLASVAILNFVGLWNQYVLAVALNAKYPENRLLSQALGAFATGANYNVDYGSLFAAVVITVVPVLIVYVIFQRQLQGSVSQGTMK
ncbi:carbohydrate ABC transporter permease [Psychromicrobium lacuslunae]|uniref:Sugar ABC transporter permease n=1 Tax=Psychromicrobium lacuslunae TaxID=1618207 RepID=A0A0D4C170_9MICC|nr:carbohydrate ABC transporter permease [Psychromicrobium lacuslunae]AJT42304.1 sugar ABC transporter permease [Psychromicrobium lacuslunae]